MKPLPADPRAFQDRVMAALAADILDVGQPGFARTEALRAVSIATSERAGDIIENELPVIRGEQKKRRAA